VPEERPDVEANYDMNRFEPRFYMNPHVAEIPDHGLEMPQIYGRCCDEIDFRNGTGEGLLYDQSLPRDTYSNMYASLECGVGIAPLLCNSTEFNTQWSLNRRNVSQIFTVVTDNGLPLCDTADQYQKNELDNHNVDCQTIEFHWVQEMPSLGFSKLPMSWYDYIRAG